jgi:predicted nucleotidyltransferase
MMFGLDLSDIQSIQEILGQFPEVQQALIFGSRAKGNFRSGSDIDIAIKGDEATHSIASKIMPYHFDVLSYRELNNKELISHIDRVGKELYNSSLLTKISSNKIKQMESPD